MELDFSGFDAPCSVRISNRAKNISFTVSKRGLEVVVPKRFSRNKISALIDEQRQWIDAALQRARVQFDGFIDPHNLARPTLLNLLAVGEIIRLHYLASNGQSVRYSLADDCLNIDFPTDAPEKIFAALRVFLKQRAKPFFNQRLAELSEQSQLPFSRINVRGQRSRWGSFSAAGVVSLNYKLLFLPPALVDHVLLHELCHGRHMNHSKQFWGLLSALDSNAEEHRNLLRGANRYIPDWVDFKG